jgi:hypothetical protein
MISNGNRCPNLNHSRTNAPVRFCPRCGEVVNENIPIRKCTTAEHARSRIEREQVLCALWRAAYTEYIGANSPNLNPAH